MIEVRPARGDDRLAFDKLFAVQGFEYERPDWAQMKVTSVVVRDGLISSAVFFRQTAETYYLMNPHLPLRKRERIGELLLLHKELKAPLARAGFTDMHCWIPPELEQQHFGRLLLHMGWTKPLWPSYSREVK